MMVVPSSLWLLSVCLLSWWGDALAQQSPDLQPESRPIPLIIWYKKGETFSTGDTEILLQVEKRRDNVLVLDYEKDFMQNENDTGLSLFSYVCDTLAMDSEMKNGYILVSLPEGFQFLNKVARECPAPPTKELFSVFKRKFTRNLKQLVQLLKTQENFPKTNPGQIQPS